MSTNPWIAQCHSPLHYKVTQGILQRQTVVKTVSGSPESLKDLLSKTSMLEQETGWKYGAVIQHRSRFLSAERPNRTHLLLRAAQHTYTNNTNTNNATHTSNSNANHYSLRFDCLVETTEGAGQSLQPKRR